MLGCGDVLIVADVTPVIQSVAPLYGPEAGGTNITLEGINLVHAGQTRCSLSGQCHVSDNIIVSIHRFLRRILCKPFVEVSVVILYYS